MAITSKTRKELWAKSGNRCAICKKELVNQISEDDGSFIIGDECHIISSSPEGPRYKPGIEDYDSYDNLLLLCKNHHREIDENCASYTEELLQYIKTSHENWVKKTLDSSMPGEASVRKPRFIKRIVSGKELLNNLIMLHLSIETTTNLLMRKNVHTLLIFFSILLIL